LSGLSIEWMRWTAPSATSIEMTLMRRPSGARIRKPGWPLTSTGSTVTSHSAAMRAKTTNARAIPSAPTSGLGSARALPPPSPTRTAPGREHGDQTLDVALARRGEEAGGERAALLGVGVEARPLLADAPAGAAEDLAAVLLGPAQHLADLGEGVVERVAQHEHGALVGRQALEQDEEREGDRLLVLDPPHRVVLHERLRQPRARVGLAAHARRTQHVDRQPGGHGGQERLAVLDALSGVQAQQRLLHHVLGLGDRAEHPVGDREGEVSERVDRHRFPRRLVGGA
jgi:hypothetical protein